MTGVAVTAVGAGSIPFAVDFERGLQQGTGTPAFHRELQRAAFERFADLGFPTQRMEDWRFTRVSAIADGDLRQAPMPGLAPDHDGKPWTFDPAWRIIFVDGHHAPHLSSLSWDIDQQPLVSSLGDALRHRPALVEQHLARYARSDHRAFVALNTALYRDGALVCVPPGTVVENPIHILHVTSSDCDDRAVFPRSLIVLGEGARATVVESHHGAASSHLSCPVTELALAPGASAELYTLQEEGVRASHIATLQVHQERGSVLRAHTISLGAALARHDIGVILDGEGGDAHLDGLSVARGRQHLDTNLRVHHARPHCTSREVYRGILADQARAVFTGRIVVDRGSQKTDARLSNRNLLLSSRARVHSNPQLEIFADDVRCTHGSTVGRLDEDAVFYLRSRGINEQTARSLLTYAFASEVVDRLELAAVRDRVATLVLGTLPHAEVLREVP